MYEFDKFLNLYRNHTIDAIMILTDNFKYTFYDITRTDVCGFMELLLFIYDNADNIIIVYSPDNMLIIKVFDKDICTRLLYVMENITD